MCSCKARAFCGDQYNRLWSKSKSLALPCFYLASCLSALGTWNRDMGNHRHILKCITNCISHPGHHTSMIKALHAFGLPRLLGDGPRTDLTSIS